VNWSAVGAAAVALAVILGAFGAHALKGRLDDYSMAIYERAGFYHFIHALGLLVVPVLRLSQRVTAWICGLLCAGILLFCGSLYVLAATGVRSLGAVTPFGGMAFIAGLLLLTYALIKQSR
jgi:uncharacterized membrane protein YgdD (TMEM256/DUF423 family)